MSDRLELEVTCRECRRSWTPTHADYIRGWWRVCADCRNTTDDTTSGGAIPDNTRLHVDVPFDVNTMRFLYAPHGHRVPIVDRTRRTITVDYFGRRLPLKRREIERTGMTQARGVRFSVTRYDLPDEAA